MSTASNNIFCIKIKDHKNLNTCYVATTKTSVLEYLESKCNNLVFIENAKTILSSDINIINTYFTVNRGNRYTVYEIRECPGYKLKDGETNIYVHSEDKIKYLKKMCTYKPINITYDYS